MKEPKILLIGGTHKNEEFSDYVARISEEMLKKSGRNVEFAEIPLKDTILGVALGRGEKVTAQTHSYLEKLVNEKKANLVFDFHCTTETLDYWWDEVWEKDGRKIRLSLTTDQSKELSREFAESGARLVSRHNVDFRLFPVNSVLPRGTSYYVIEIKSAYRDFPRQLLHRAIERAPRDINQKYVESGTSIKENIERLGILPETMAKVIAGQIKAQVQLYKAGKPPTWVSGKVKKVPQEYLPYKSRRELAQAGGGVAKRIELQGKWELRKQKIKESFRRNIGRIFGKRRKPI